MKISKENLKKIIKEEIQKATLSEQQTIDKVIKMRVGDFLKLTTDEEQYPISDLEKRYPHTFTDKNPFTRQSLEKQKYMPYLEINNQGKVINHNGRLRMYALSKLEGDSAIANITIRTPSDYNLESNSVLTNQFNSNTTTDINK